MINIIGLGYIGLPTAIMLATHGFEVVGTDCDKELITSLNSGTKTFNEDELAELYQKAVESGIKFSSAYQKTDTYIVAVPTPYNRTDKKVDPCFIVSAVKSIMDVCEQGSTIVIESTVSPGTIDKSIRPILNPELDLNLVHAPERIIPGKMIFELINNNRTIGADSKEVGERIKRLYQSFCRGEIVVTDIKTTEMTKVVENTYRAVNIAFANELSRICRYENMDVNEVIKICNMHPRVNILQPGPGVGGHCIPVDPWFLVGDYPSLTNVICQAMKTNDSQPDFVKTRINEIMKEHGISNYSRVGLYGLSFKENVDDTRNSPTLQLLDCFEKDQINGLKVYDPLISKDIVCNQYHSFEAFLNDIDFLVVMVKHNEIRDKQDRLIGKIVLDCHNFIDIEGVCRI